MIDEARVDKRLEQPRQPQSTSLAFEEDAVLETVATGPPVTCIGFGFRNDSQRASWWSEPSCSDVLATPSWGGSPPSDGLRTDTNLLATLLDASPSARNGRGDKERGDDALDLNSGAFHKVWAEANRAAVAKNSACTRGKGHHHRRQHRHHHGTKKRSTPPREDDDVHIGEDLRQRDTEETLEGTAASVQTSPSMETSGTETTTLRSLLPPSEEVSLTVDARRVQDTTASKERAGWSSPSKTMKKKRRFGLSGAFLRAKAVLLKRSEKENARRRRERRQAFAAWSEQKRASWELVVSLMPVTGDVEFSVIFKKRLRELAARTVEAQDVDARGRSLLWIAVSKNDAFAVRELLDVIFAASTPTEFLRWLGLADDDFDQCPEARARVLDRPNLVSLIEYKRHRAERALELEHAASMSSVAGDVGRDMKTAELAAELGNPVFAGLAAASRVLKRVSVKARAKVRGEEAILPTRADFLRQRERQAREAAERKPRRGSRIQGVDLKNPRLGAFELGSFNGATR